VGRASRANVELNEGGLPLGAKHREALAWAVVSTARDARAGLNGSR